MLLHLGRGTYYTLDAVGSFVWRRIDGDTTLSEIAAAITATFEVRPEEAWDDLVDLLAELEDEGLIALEA